VNSRKKNDLGHSKTDDHEVSVYFDRNSGAFCSNMWIDNSASTRDSTDWNESWIENILIFYNSSMFYRIDRCDTANLFVLYLSNNSIYILSGTEVYLLVKSMIVLDDLTSNNVNHID